MNRRDVLPAWLQRPQRRKQRQNAFAGAAGCNHLLLVLTTDENNYTMRTQLTQSNGSKVTRPEATSIAG